MWITDLVISYSWWSLVLVFLTGILFAGTLYTFNKRNKLSRNLTIILFIFRFLSVSLMAFLLLSPYLKTQVKNIIKPIIVVGIDNSKSIAHSTDSTYYKTQFQNQLFAQIEQLKDEYQVKTYLFGSQISRGENIDFSDPLSNYGMFLNNSTQIADISADLIILAGDGINNSGYDPLYIAQNIETPIVAIAMGDTIDKSDAAVVEIRMNHTVFPGDVVPMEITYKASMLQNKQLNLKVTGFGKTLYQETIAIKSSQHIKTITLPIQVVGQGKKRIQVTLDALPEESNHINNQLSSYLNVVESKQKILLLAHAPHPDISAISQAVNNLKQYELTTEVESTFNGQTKGFDLIILHQIPASGNSSKVLSALDKNNTAVLYITGPQSNLSKFNTHFPGLNILTASNRFEEATPTINRQFSLFTFSDNNQRILNQFPPLTVPLGSYEINPSAHVFSRQSINGFDTDFPLVLYYTNGIRKTAVIVGEGIWRWRMFNFVAQNETNTFDTFIQKTIQYLLSTENKRPFQLFARNEYSIFEPITIQARCYNASGEQVNSEEIPLTLTNESGEIFQYQFSKEGLDYHLNLGLLPEGIYKYQATTTLSNSKLSESGEFMVTGLSLETRNTRANHRLLHQLAARNDGHVLYPKNLDQLLLIIESYQFKPKIEYQTQLIDLGQIPYILIIIVMLLSLEWFLRKYFGTY